MKEIAHREGKGMAKVVIPAAAITGAALGSMEGGGIAGGIAGAGIASVLHGPVLTGLGYGAIKARHSIRHKLNQSDKRKLKNQKELNKLDWYEGKISDEEYKRNR